MCEDHGTFAVAYRLNLVSDEFVLRWITVIRSILSTDKFSTSRKQAALSV